MLLQEFTEAGHFAVKITVLQFADLLHLNSLR